MTIRVAVMLAFATLFAGAAHAESVGSSTALCRSAPSTRSSVLAKLAPGTRVSVAERREPWTRVVARRRRCWLASRLLIEDTSATGVGASTSYASVRTARATSTRRLRVARRAGRHRFGSGGARRAAHASRRGAYSYGGSCPCGSGRICIGPRGGRYCITRGGYKEYGQ